MQRKIKILFDAGPLVNGNRTGVGKTTVGLIQSLADNYPADVELVGHYFDFMGRKHVADMPSAPNIRYVRTTLIPGKVFNMLRRMGVWIPFELLTKERGDFHLFPGFIGWPSMFRTPSAPFVHDITYIDLPQYVNGPAQFDLKTIMPRTIRRSAFIITNTESSRSGIVRHYDLRDKPILVEHLPAVDAVTLDPKDATARVKALGITQPYLLFFGTLEPRKNLVSLIKAYENLNPKLQRRYALVIGGGKGWKDTEILASIERLKKSGGKVIQTGYVSDEDRAALYMNTALFVLPSHYEGFGMQLLECMFYSAPMLISDIPVLREVAGDSAVYCQTDPASIKIAIQSILSDPKLQQKIVAAGNRRIRKFSWKRVSAELFEAIRRVVR